MRNTSDPTGNRIRDIPACSAVPPLTTPPAACPTPKSKIMQNTAQLILKLYVADKDVHVFILVLSIKESNRRTFKGQE